MALEPPAEARAALRAWRRELTSDHGDNLRPVGEDALHLTLAFIGYRAERDIEAIGDAVGTATAGRAAPGLDFLRDLAPRPPRHPRFYAAPLRERDDLIGLRAAIAGELAGRRLFEDERRAFWPHITLCRVKSSARDHRPPAQLPDAPAALTARTFAAEQVTLYRSHLEPAGARYEALASFTLALAALSEPD